MLNIGPPELILIFVIALLIVGPQRLPELGRTIGKAMREIRKLQNEVQDLVNTGMGDDFKQTAAELRRTAADLKSATDVRSAFHDEPRARRTAPPSSSPALGGGGAERSSLPSPTAPGDDEEAAE